MVQKKMTLFYLNPINLVILTDKLAQYNELTKVLGVTKVFVISYSRALLNCACKNY